MKIVRLDKNYNVNTGFTIAEDSEDGIQQAIKEAISIQKGFDITDPSYGVDWKHFAETGDIETLSTDIQTAISSIVYILYLTKLTIENKNNGVVNISLEYKYMNDEDIEKQGNLEYSFNNN